MRMKRITVNGEEIPESAIAFELARLTRFYFEHGISEDEIKKSASLLRDRAIDQAIGAKLLLARTAELDIRVTAADIDAEVAKVVSQLGGEENYRKALAAQNMEMLGLSPIANRSFQELSGGQQQRVLLARALCATKKCLVLDEPTTGLDPVVTAEFYRVLHAINAQGMTIIMVSHDIEEAVRDCSHILHLSCHPLFIGTAQAYKASPIGRKYLSETSL